MLICAGIGFGNIVRAQNKPVYHLAKIIALPGNGAHDYLYYNQKISRLYVTHGTTVDVINVKKNQYIGSVTGLGKDHGIAIDNRLHRGFISDNVKRDVAVFDTRNFKITKTIPLKGEDEDAMVLDPVSGNIFVFEGHSKQAEVINPVTMAETDIIHLEGEPEFAVTNGHGLIFNNLEDISKIAVIDVRKMAEIRKYDLGPCVRPSGLALDKTHHRLFAGCRSSKNLAIINAKNGAFIQSVPIGAGNDAVKYDPVTHLIFASCKDGTTTIIKQISKNNYKTVQVLKTRFDARTMAIDTSTHRIYLSTMGYRAHNDHEILPNSFEVLVYTMK